jgi:hypothetical protein
MSKKIAVSIGIIAVLVLYLIVSNIKRSSDVPDLKLPGGMADEILISRSNGTVKIFKKEGKWVINDEAYPADTKIVGDIEKRFREIRLTDLVSSKGYYAKYDLTPDMYTGVIFKKKNAVIQDFKIGKKSTTSQHTFVKIDDKPEIYLAEGTFDIVINKGQDDFRDREVLRISRDAVREFTVNYNGMELAFAREATKKPDAKGAKGKDEKPGGDQWVCRSFPGVALDAGRVNSLLQGLDPLRATSFPDIKKDVLPQRLCMVQIKAFQKDIILTLFKKDGQYLATTSENPYVFGVEKWNIEKFLLTGIDSLKAEVKK